MDYASPIHVAKADGMLCLGSISGFAISQLAIGFVEAENAHMFTYQKVPCSRPRKCLNESLLKGRHTWSTRYDARIKALYR